MRSFLIAAIAFAVLALAGIAGGTFVIGRASPAGDEQGAKGAYRAFLAGLDKGDQKGVGALLDRRFVWIGADGRSHSRREALKEFPALSAASRAEGADRDVQSQFYGRMFTVRGNHENTRFLRVFVKRQHGWKAIVLMETPVTAADTSRPVEHSAGSGGSGDCDNPCRVVPYLPKIQTEKDVLAAWQKTKMLEWKPDPVQWGNLVADELIIVSNAAIEDKQERVAALSRQEKAGGGTPGDPVASMRILSFGTCCALMLSRQNPYAGGKPYATVGIWVRKDNPKDNPWKLALSQQVSIQAAPAVAAMASRE